MFISRIKYLLVIYTVEYKIFCTRFVKVFLINFRDNCRDSLIKFFPLRLNKMYYIQDNLYSFDNIELREIIFKRY